MSETKPAKPAKGPRKGRVASPADTTKAPGPPAEPAEALSSGDRRYEVEEGAAPLSRTRVLFEAATNGGPEFVGPLLRLLEEEAQEELRVQVAPFMEASPKADDLGAWLREWEEKIESALSRDVRPFRDDAPEWVFHRMRFAVARLHFVSRVRGALSTGHDALSFALAEVAAVPLADLKEVRARKDGTMIARFERRSGAPRRLPDAKTLARIEVVARRHHSGGKLTWKGALRRACEALELDANPESLARRLPLGRASFGRT